MKDTKFLDYVFTQFQIQRHLNQNQDPILNFLFERCQPSFHSACEREVSQHRKTNKTSTNQQSADQGLMISRFLPEDPAGETDCCTFVLFQDNK